MLVVICVINYVSIIYFNKYVSGKRNKANNLYERMNV